MVSVEKTLFFYTLLIVLAAWSGAAIPLVANWRRSTVRLFISFGAGVILGAAFLHMIPESAELIDSGVGIPLLLGFLSLYVTEKFIMVHSCEAEDCQYHTVGWSAFLGLSLHSMIDGVALGAGLVFPKISVVIFLAILLHKFPASFSLASVLLHEKFSHKKIMISVLVFSLMVPIGAMATIYIFESVSQATIGWLIAFSAGTFLHVAADDLLPEVHASHTDRKATLSTFLIGVMMMWISQNLGK